MNPSPSEPNPTENDTLKASWQAFRLVLHDYHWITKLIAVALVLCCILGAGVAFWGEGLLMPAAENKQLLALERLLVSDPFRMLLTLVFALLIAVSIKRRQEAGLLDGDDHYSIGRALAFGYYKNFLVGTLLLAREKNRQLFVFKPQTVDELRHFERALWPDIVRKIQTRSEDVRPGQQQPLTRRVVVIGAATDDDGQEFWLDFPSTLFTVGDYYESWNRWLAHEGKATIHPEQLKRLEQKQIDSFFQHLRALLSCDIGQKAVQELELNRGELKTLLEKHYVELNLEQLRERLALVEPAP